MQSSCRLRRMSCDGKGVPPFITMVFDVSYFSVEVAKRVLWIGIYLRIG
jgi:hypothetical protein